MKRQKRKEAGITLIALVISIIVMLILAGVSINATVGDNGILKQAMEASNKQKLAQEIENLNLELAKLNIETITNNEADSIQDIVDYLIKQGVIDKAVTTKSGSIAVGVDRETGSRYFFGKKGEHIYKISRGKDDILVAELTQSTSGGDITGGSSLVTADSFDNSSTNPEEKGRFTITGDSNVAFMDTISGELSIYVQSGVHATVEIYADMTLTNAGVQRSAIDIEPGGILDLYIAKDCTVTVDSGSGIKGGTGETASDLFGGMGGYAGIHVPHYDEDTTIYNYKIIDGAYATEEDEEENIIRVVSSSKVLPAGDAILNLSGEGEIYAYGGDAGDGGACAGRGLDAGGAGGGGAGAGIGGNGGEGGKASTIAFSKGTNEDPYTYEGSEGDGRNGEDCGIINIKGNLTVYAYSGASGLGGGAETARNPGGGGRWRWISSCWNWWWRSWWRWPEMQEELVEVSLVEQVSAEII